MSIYSGLDAVQRQLNVFMSDERTWCGEGGGFLKVMGELAIMLLSDEDSSIKDAGKLAMNVQDSKGFQRDQLQPDSCSISSRLFSSLMTMSLFTEVLWRAC